MLVVRHIKWIMLVSGLVTCTAIYALVAPQAALLSTFGETLEGPLATLIVRQYGVLVALMGVLLIHGAFNPHVRNLVLSVVGISKLIFMAQVIWHGSLYLGHQAGLAVLFDSVSVVLFGWYLLAARQAREN